MISRMANKGLPPNPSEDVTGSIYHAFTEDTSVQKKAGEEKFAALDRPRDEGPLA